MEIGGEAVVGVAFFRNYICGNLSALWHADVCLPPESRSCLAHAVAGRMTNKADFKMIARIWHGAVPLEKSEAYLEKMRSVALPGYRNVEGNQGAWVMHRIEGDVAHFDMLTFWDDVEAIKRFAGEDYKVSYYFDFDDDFLIEKEPHVRHWEMYAD